MKRFLIKLFHYEYWPMWAFYIPLLPFFFYHGLRKGRLFFFTNVNRGMDDYGGLFFDSKMSVDRFIPPEYRPKTLEFTPGSNIQNAELEMPVIIKPDQGERGRAVHLVRSTEEMRQILDQTKEKLLIQEYIDLPEEYGVFIALIPESNGYEVISVTKKKYFEIEGDGVSSVSDLIKKSNRGTVFYDEILSISKADPLEILVSGEKRVLHMQGNHCKGTEFINANHLINSNMNESFNVLLKQIGVFEYGRFDLKVGSEKDLETFKNLKIIEFNGLAAEPTTVYDSATGYINALFTFILHWRILLKLSDYKLNKSVKPRKDIEIFRKIRRQSMDKK